MKRTLLVLAVVVVCSGQMCGTNLTSGGSTQGTLDYSGSKNICSRSWFDQTYRVGIDLPAGIGEPQDGGAADGVASKLTWDWNGTSPATKFILVISTPIGSTTIEQVSEASAAQFRQSNFTIMEAFGFTLPGDSSPAWYFAISPNDKDNINVEMVMTLTQERLVTFSATYASTIAQDKTDTILNVLKSLCADVQ